MSRAGRFRQLEDALQSVAKAIAAPPGRWWFQLQDAEAEAAARTSWFWLAATGTLFALFVSITTDVTARFFKGGPDLVGMLGTIAQAGIGLLTGAAFTGAGARSLDARMKARSVSARFRSRVHFGMALAAALLSLALYLCLPRIAAAYNDVGVGHQDARRVLSAIDAYQRAIAPSGRYDGRWNQARYVGGSQPRREGVPRAATFAGSKGSAPACARNAPAAVSSLAQPARNP